MRVPGQAAALDAGGTDPCVDLWVGDRQAGVRRWLLEAVGLSAACAAQLDFFSPFDTVLKKKSL